MVHVNGLIVQDLYLVEQVNNVEKNGKINILHLLIKIIGHMMNNK